jgi:hypothetical protein
LKEQKEGMMSKAIPDEVQRQIEQMTETFRQQLITLYEWSNGAQVDDEPRATEIEQRIRQWIGQIGQDTQILILGGMDRNRRKGKQGCPACDQAVYWKDYAPRNYITTLGEMELERAYYHHGACHRGWVPLDERLGLGASELSPLVQEMASYLGGFMPFERAQHYLARYQNIHISHDTVKDTTVTIGQGLGERQAEAIRQAWEEGRLPACELTTPPQRLYVSADGINYLLPDGQGKEIRVAAVYETEERQNKKGETEVKAINLEYVVATDVETLARAAYLTAVKRGAELAAEIVISGDGANWIWNRITPMFPGQKVTEVVDFYHASEYIWDAGQAVFGSETPETEAWAQKQCHALKHEGPETVLASLRTLCPADSQPPELVTKAITYFGNQAQRMDYPTYIQQGLQIGSGSAESAVKQVVGVRLNQPGMRWGPEHAEAVAHVRAAILSHRWDDFWSDFQPPPRQYNRKDLPLAA